jgi:HrpA-like RNA helicase
MLDALDEQEKITEIGNIMANLPTDPIISRALIEAKLRKCF